MRNSVGWILEEQPQESRRCSNAAIPSVSSTPSTMILLARNLQRICSIHLLVPERRKLISCRDGARRREDVPDGG